MSGGDIILLIIALFAMYYLVNNISCSNINEGFQYECTSTLQCSLPQNSGLDSVCVFSNNTTTDGICNCIPTSSGTCDTCTINKYNNVIKDCNNSGDYILKCSDGQCGCGNYFNSNIACPGEIGCPNGQIIDQNTGSCACPEGQVYINNKCACPGGQMIDPNTRLCACPTGTGLVYINNKCACPEGQEYINNKCACPEGQEYINNKCA
jgi:hypothetical protein